MQSTCAISSECCHAVPVFEQTLHSLIQCICHFKQKADQKYSLILGGGRIAQSSFSGVLLSTLIRHGQFLSMWIIPFHQRLESDFRDYFCNADNGPYSKLSVVILFPFWALELLSALELLTLCINTLLSEGRNWKYLFSEHLLIFELYWHVLHWHTNL